MRLYELTEANYYLNDRDYLREGFVSNIASAIGNKITQNVSIVNNAASAIQVIFQVASNPQYLETFTFLLKKFIKQGLGLMKPGKIKQLIISRFPQGRQFKDFLMSLFLVSVMNTISRAVGYAKDALIDNLKDQAGNFIKDTLSAAFGNLNTWITAFCNASGSAATGGAVTALGTIMKGLGIANDILFATLAGINKKIKSNPIQNTQQTSQPVPAVSQTQATQPMQPMQPVA